MASIRSGHRAVLLVVDVQVGVMAQAWEAARVVANVALAVQRARAQQAPVLWVQHEQPGEMPHGSPQWQWVPELLPAADEPLIAKRYNSAFEDTTLEAQLAQRGATHLVLAGAASNWCIRATAYAALDRGYDLTLVRDAHSTESMDLGSGVQVAARDIVSDLNIAMTWLSYPGRTNAAVAAAALDFSTPPQGAAATAASA